MAKRNTITLALTALFVLGLAAGATAGIPDTNNSTATANNCGRFTIAPGGGEDLNDPGVPQDYTISVTVLDINGDPVDNLAATDLEIRHDDLSVCASGGSQADGPTDANGQTTFSGTIYGGMDGDLNEGIVCDDAQLLVYALGIVLNGGNPVCVATDSPDLNGSLDVTAADFAKFAADFNCVSGGIPCDSCHDYNEDGETSVPDFAIFASYFNLSVCAP